MAARASSAERQPRPIKSPAVGGYAGPGFTVSPNPNPTPGPRPPASAPASGGRVQKDVRHQALRHPELPRDLIRLHAHRSVDDPAPLGGTTDFLLSWATRATRFVF